MPTYRCPMFAAIAEGHLNGDAACLRDTLQPAIAYEEGHSEVQEVILTGGDPLMLRMPTWRGARRLSWDPTFNGSDPLVSLSPFHNGLTHHRSALSERSETGLVTTLIIRESLIEQAQQAISHLRAAGVELANQAVLLRGVNGSGDSVSAIPQLDAVA